MDPEECTLFNVCGLLQNIRLENIIIVAELLKQTVTAQNLILSLETPHTIFPDLS